jgi:NADPH2:quinone reductase
MPGTAAEFTVVPVDHVAPFPENVSPEQGACLGIPGVTAHRAVHVGGDVAGRTALVQGAGGAVGMCGLQLARYADARLGTWVSVKDDGAGAALCDAAGAFRSSHLQASFERRGATASNGWA